MAKGGGKKRKTGRNPDGSVTQGLARGDPREEKLRKLVNQIYWDGDETRPEDRKAVDLAPSQPDFIVAVKDFFSRGECKQLMDMMEKVGLNEASKADKTPRKNEAYLDRESLKCECDLLYDKIWTRLKPLAPKVQSKKAVGLTTKLRYYIYRKGQRFDAHVDVSNKGLRQGEETEYTLLLYLNSSSSSTGVGVGVGGNDEEEKLVGGDTIFWETKKKELCRVSPLTGMLLLHAHGRRCLLHAGDRVLKGAKYMIRCDVMYGPE